MLSYQLDHGGTKKILVLLRFDRLVAFWLVQSEEIVGMSTEESLLGRAILTELEMVHQWPFGMLSRFVWTVSTMGEPKKSFSRRHSIVLGLFVALQGDKL